MKSTKGIEELENSISMKEDDKEMEEESISIADVSELLTKRVIQKTLMLHNIIDVDDINDIDEVNKNTDLISDKSLLATKAIIVFHTKTRLNLSIIEKRFVNNKMFKTIAEETNTIASNVSDFINSFLKKLETKDYLDMILNGVENGYTVKNGLEYEIYSYSNLEVKIKNYKKTILSAPVYCLSNDNRTLNALYRKNITTLGELVKIVRGDRLGWFIDNKIKGIGKKQAIIIESELLKRGLIQIKEEYKYSKAEQLKEIRRQKKLDAITKEIKDVAGQKGIELYNMGFNIKTIKALAKSNLLDINDLVDRIKSNRLSWYDSYDIHGIAEIRADEIERILIHNKLLTN